jgi:hypothetical protein
MDYMVMYFWQMVFAWLPWFILIFGMVKAVDNKKTKGLEIENKQLKAFYEKYKGVVQNGTKV